MSNIFLDCPVDCDTDLLLVAIPEEQDCTSYDQQYSQVSDLVIQPTGATTPFASWSTTPTLVSGAIDNTVTDNSKCKWLVGEGGIATPTKEVSDYPKRKQKTTNRRYRLEHTIRNLTDAQYDFCRQLQCGWTGFTFWHADLGDYIYGSATGIVPALVDCDFPKGAGRDDKSFATIIIEWDADGDPERRVSPLA